MPLRVVSTREQQPITVDAMVANPLVIPERIVSVTRDQFIMDQVLRRAGEAKGGAVQFRVSSGLFADRGSEIVNEGAEIPVATVTRGDLQSKPVPKRGLAVVVTREMRSRNAVGEVERQVQVVKNTIVRDIDASFLATLTAAVSQTRAATAAWSGGTATIRKDINAARLLITQSQAPGTTGGNNFMGFRPTHLLINPTTEADLLNSTEFQAMLFGSTGASNTAELPAEVLKLKPLVSPSVGAGVAWVIQAKEVGGYGDEYPLEATELYEHRPTQTFRSDTTRSTVGFVDQPLAAAKITGV